MGKKQFFLISQVFYPDQVSTANLFTKLALKIAERKDVEVTVWCAQPSYDFRNRQPSKVIYKDIHIHYLPSTSFRKKYFLGRLINYLTFMLSVAAKLIFSPNKSAVFTHTTPPTLAILLSFLCKVKRRKFVYVLLDIFPEGLVRVGKLKKSSFIKIVWEKLFRKSLKRSDKIIVIGRDMQDYIIDFYPLAADKTQYIPIWQDEKLIEPLAMHKNPFIRKYELEEKFIIQFSGNMGLWNDMQVIGKAINKSEENLFYLIIGDGMRKGELLKSIDAVNDRYMMLPFLPNNEYAQSVATAHIALVTLRDGLEGMAVPSKIIGIMAAGVPVVGIVPGESEIAKIINEEQCGIVVEPGHTGQLIEEINKLKNDETLRMEMGQRGRRAFLEKYTTTIIAQKYIQLIQ